MINAEGLILGRLSSEVAKKLLNGERVIIVNAENAIISGKKKMKIMEAKEFLEVGYPRKGPFHYRKPDKILRITVRGMLPYRKAKGKQAYKRLYVYHGVPLNLKDEQMETIETAQAKNLKCSYFTLGELAKEIGWKGE
jgi:large subunit ribosomal protein L13